MNLTWNDFYNLINTNLITSTLASYSIEKILDYIISKIKEHNIDTLEEQVIICIDNALQGLCKIYCLEYDIDVCREFIGELIENRKFFSEEIFKQILSDTLDMEVDSAVLENWLFLINKTIAENRLEILRDYILMNKSMERTIEKAYPRILTSKPSLPPEEYIERTEKNTILKKLEESKKLVLVNGFGGIGKSTVCKKIFHELSKQGERTLAWVVYGDGNLLDDFRKQLFFPKGNKDWEKRFIQFLQQDIEEEAVLFIDNLNVSEEEEPFLQDLANANCNVICSSRISNFQHYEVVPVDFLNEEDCIKLFYNYYGLQYDEQIIKNIITKAGKHTLVIEILAKIGRAEEYSLEDFENKLEREGFDLEGIATIGASEDTLIGHLCKTFDTKKLNEEQKVILICLAILPVQRIPVKLKTWLQLSNNYNINYLAKHAWYIKDENGFYMHPVLKEVVKRVIAIKENALLRLLAGLEKELSYIENPDFENSMFLISCSETVLDNLSETSMNLAAQLIYNIATRYAQFGIFDKALKNTDLCLKTLNEKRGMEELLGSVYDLRGYIYYYTFKDKQAEENYIKAYELRKNNKKKKPLAQTVASLALLYQGMWNELNSKDSKEAVKLLILSSKYQNTALKLFEKIFNGKQHPNMASAYNNMAVLQNSLKNYEQANFYYKKAENIRLSLKESNRTDLAVTYLGISRNFKDMYRVSKNQIHQLFCLKASLLYLKKSRLIRVEEIRKGNQKLDIDAIIKEQAELEAEIIHLKQHIVK